MPLKSTHGGKLMGCPWSTTPSTVSLTWAENKNIQERLGQHKPDPRPLIPFKMYSLPLQCACPCVSVEVRGQFGGVEGVSMQSVLVEEGAQTVHP